MSWREGSALFVLIENGLARNQEIKIGSYVCNPAMR